MTAVPGTRSWWRWRPDRDAAENESIAGFRGGGLRMICGPVGQSRSSFPEEGLQTASFSGRKATMVIVEVHVDVATFSGR